MKTLILNHEQVIQKINRLSWQIYERHMDSESLVIAGIADRGYLISGLVAKTIAEISEMKVEHIRIDINKEDPDIKNVMIDTELGTIKKSGVIIIDDVLNSGRIIMYAAQPFLNNKNPVIHTAVLVDRDHRNFPVSADFAGLSLSTTFQEHVEVQYTNGQFEVFLK